MTIIKNHIALPLGKLTLGLVLMASVGAGCKSMNKTQKGAVIGAAAGGAVGAGVGKAAGNTALGAIIGATVGGVTGAVIGRQMDKQAKEIENIPGAQVERVGEGINVTFDSGVLFGYDQADLTPSATDRVKELTTILNKYPDTYILVEGHTDSKGTANYNMNLSERRAEAVSAYLIAQNISAARVKTAWYGENQPKFSNDTEAERAKNRRVEFAIYANEKMVEDAKKESGATGQ